MNSALMTEHPKLYRPTFIDAFSETVVVEGKYSRVFSNAF